MNKYIDAMLRLFCDSKDWKSFRGVCTASTCGCCEHIKICPTYKSVDLIEKLVNKETPIKPYYEGDGCDSDGNIIYDTWICPNCGKSYEVDFEEFERCPHCGQLIDWSKEDE